MRIKRTWTISKEFGDSLKSLIVATDKAAVDKPQPKPFQCPECGSPMKKSPAVQHGFNPKAELHRCPQCGFSMPDPSSSRA